MTGIRVHDPEFVRSHVPTYLERSLQLALAGVHAPFFTYREGAAFVVVVERQEWERLAPRFPAAATSAGFRLVSVTPNGSDTGFPARLKQVLSEGGVQAQLLPSFHNDHLLVSATELDRCLALVRPLLGG